MKRLIKIKNIFSAIHINRRRWIIASCSSIILLFLSYLHNNLPLFTGENIVGYACAEWIRNKIDPDTIEETNVVYINTAYDRQLTTYKEDGMVQGNADITDREKLLKLLQGLQQTAYKYIFIDIRFEKGCESENPAVDSALFAQIANMDSIVLVCHHDLKNMAGVPVKKMAYNDYYSTISTGFIRYQYMMGKDKTMPIYAYKELTGDSISRHLGMFFFSSGRPCYNSLFLTFSPNKKVSGSRNNMGKYILQSKQFQSDLSKMANGKIVVIGDMTHDLHDTYSGEHAGGQILASAMLALMNGKHLVNGWLMLFLFLLYFLLTLGLLSDKRWYEYIPFIKNIHFPLLRYLLSFIGFSALFFCISFLLGACFRMYVTFLFPSIWFSILSAYINYKRNAY